MIQQNISFDSFYGRILDPLCYKLLENQLGAVLGTNKKLAPGLHNILFDNINKYVDKLKPQNKNDYKVVMYYILMNCINKLLKYNRPLDKIMQPEKKEDYLVQKLYLIPILDIMTLIHPNGHETNTFCYDYIINQMDEFKDCPYLYIYQNASNPNSNIIQIESNKIFKYLKDNNLCLNISGALFYTHEKHTGLMTSFLDHRLKMRSEYKKLRDESDYGTDNYKKYEHIQKVCKVNANSSYGLTGLNSFRYSNVWLARSTTLSGRVCLKTSQIAGELVIKTQYDEN